MKKQLHKEKKQIDGCIIYQDKKQNIFILWDICGEIMD